jgi:hypothetical protein
MTSGENSTDSFIAPFLKGWSILKFRGGSKAKVLWARFELIHTSKHGSWLDMAEIQINVMVRQCLNGTPRSGRLAGSSSPAQDQDQLALHH